MPATNQTLLDTPVPEVINMHTIIDDEDPRIRVRSMPVELPLSKEDEELLLKMHQYVIDSQDEEKCENEELLPAVGLAAIQLGINKQMLAVYSGDLGKNSFSWALVNPKIISKSKITCHLKDGEGCLSVPDRHIGVVCRPARIKVRAWDLLSRQDVVIDAIGYEAIVLQHEIDHLSGILYYDHIDLEHPTEPLPNSYEIG
jgi:peptide deformylase